LEGAAKTDHLSCEPGSIDLIRDQLDLCGIAEGKLFPDLDGLVAEMRRYYATSAERANPST
jgi:hypothetical protein